MKSFTLRTVSLVFFGLSIITSCTTTRVAVISSEETISLYTTTLPEQPYKELHYIETSGGIFHTPQHLLNGLKKEAIAQQADAVVNIRYDFQGWWPIVSGTSIQFTD